MSDIKRRLKKAEQTINVDRPESPIVVVVGSDEKLTPEYEQGNIITIGGYYGRERKQ